MSDVVSLILGLVVGGGWTEIVYRTGKRHGRLDVGRLVHCCPAWWRELTRDRRGEQ